MPSTSHRPCQFSNKDVDAHRRAGWWWREPRDLGCTATRARSVLAPRRRSCVFSSITSCFVLWTFVLTRSGCADEDDAGASGNRTTEAAGRGKCPDAWCAGTAYQVGARRQARFPRRPPNTRIRGASLGADWSSMCVCVCGRPNHSGKPVQCLSCVSFTLPPSGHV